MLEELHLERSYRRWLLGGLLVLLVAAVLMTACAGDRQQFEHEIEPLYSVEDPQFLRTMGHLLGPPLVSGNEVVPLINGNEIFPAMLEAIESAEESISFETYVYWEGDIGEQFADALAQKARDGVPVKVLIDWFGMGNIEQEYVKLMTDAGVDVEIYHPVAWYTWNKMNNRTHRKLLVVDGEIGFTGGVGIADEWSGDARNENEWRDNHYLVRGPVVAHMQRAFMDNWLITQAEVLHGEDYYPPLKEHGQAHAQMFISSPRAGSESVRLMYLLSIAAARENIRIATPYFVPDELAIEMLTEAEERGVEVEIIVPGPHMDFEIVRKASRADWGRLLEAGVEIYEYQPTMYHTKMMIVDDLWTSVGSTNFDNRSFRLNDEANLNVYDRSFAQSQIEVFEEDLSNSRLITFEDWSGRPLNEKLTDELSNLVDSQL